MRGNLPSMSGGGMGAGAAPSGGGPSGAPTAEHRPARGTHTRSPFGGAASRKAQRVRQGKSRGQRGGISGGTSAGQPIVLPIGVGGAGGIGGHAAGRKAARQAMGATATQGMRGARQATARGAMLGIATSVSARTGRVHVPGASKGLIMQPGQTFKYNKLHPQYFVSSGYGGQYVTASTPAAAARAGGPQYRSRRISPPTRTG